MASRSRKSPNTTSAPRSWSRFDRASSRWASARTWRPKTSELALFFALGADLYRHKIWLKNFYAQKEFDPWPNYPRNVFDSIMRAFKARGFSGTGQFLLPPASVNYC